MSGAKQGDRETGSSKVQTGDSKHSLRAWLYLLKCSKKLDQIMSARLRQSYGSSLSRFDVLAHLDLAGDAGLSTSALAAKLLASRGNITRLLDRMEHDGLIFRNQHSSDRRVHNICLSRTGAELFRRMAPDHEHWTHEILSVLEPAEQEELVRLLKTVRARLEDVL